MRSSLAGFLARRLAASLLVLLLVLSLAFFFVHLTPGDPDQVLLDPRASPAQRDALYRLYGLDRPLAVQYATWLRNILLRGDLGVSFFHQQPVLATLASRVPATLLLAVAAMGVQYATGLLLGMAAARRPGAVADHLIRLGSLTLYSLPVFWLGLMALLLLSHRWPLFPAGHMHSVGAAGLAPGARLLDLAHHLALPALVLGLAAAGSVARHLRNSLLEVLGEEFIRTARAKGLGERRVVWLHALRNAASPLLQLLGLSLPFLLSGALVVEVVFSWPGMGRLTYEAISGRDYPLILGSTLMSGVLVIGGNLLADLLNALADPRVRG